MRNEHKIFIPGAAGRLETVIGRSMHDVSEYLGIICHPHPLYGGTMDNKVVTTISKAFSSLDITPVRFNFRGVGSSEGEFDHGRGEIDDLMSIIQGIGNLYGQCRLILAGFSFGSYIATKVASQICPQALITVAPPVHHQDFYSLLPITFPWLLVQGEQDEVVPVNEVYTWFESLAPKPELIKMKGVSHYFHGHLIELREIVVDFLTPIVSA